MIAGIAPVVLLLGAMALVFLSGRFLDAQHHVAVFICLAGVVGLALYCVRRESGRLRLWGIVLLAIGVLLVALVAVGMLVSNR